MVSQPLPAHYRLSYRDWLATPDDGMLREIVDGEIFVTPTPVIKHQRISRELEFRILQILRTHDLGEILDAPVGVKLSDEDVLEPDLVVIRKEHAARVLSQYIEGAPDLVIEILSPGTARHDLHTKRDRYELFQVPEYWIVDPEAESIEILVLRDGRYARHGVFHRSGTAQSALISELTFSLAGVFPG